MPSENPFLGIVTLWEPGKLLSLSEQRSPESYYRFRAKGAWKATIAFRAPEHFIL